MAQPDIVVVDAPRCVLGESPFWDVADGVLWWTDIERGLVHRLEPDTGWVSTLPVGGKAAFAVPKASGGMVLGTETGLYDLDPASGRRALICDPEADRRQNRFNDFAIDPLGRLFAGSSPVSPPGNPDAAFWRIQADGTADRVLGGITTCNGLAFSPDGGRIYLADTDRAVRTVFMADYHVESGWAGAFEVFFDTRVVRGRPDGAAVDADGCYWMAGVGGGQLVRLTPDGVIDRIVELPVDKPTKPAFGGAGLDVLFVTSIGGERAGEEDGRIDGALLAITGLGVTGLVTPRYAR